MNPAQAKGLILVAMLASGAVVVVRDVRQGAVPRLRVFIGGVLVAVILTALADAIPRITGLLAATILVSAVLDTTADTWRALARLITGGTE